MVEERLSNRVAIVTGAGGSIGRAICVAFAAHGAKVLCSDINGKTAAATAALIAADGGKADSFVCDVSRLDQACATIDTAIEQFGALHILVNNAAVFPSQATIVDLDEAEWDEALAVNIGGAFNLSRFAIPRITAAGGGSIIHVASQMAKVANAGQTAYCTTKGALLMLAKGMALDHADQNIRVNTLSPGGIATDGMARKWGGMDEAERRWGRPKHPLGRLGRVDEVARAAVFLASDDSSFMTGADLVIDGGYTAW